MGWGYSPRGCTAGETEARSGAATPPGSAAGQRTPESHEPAKCRTRCLLHSRGEAPSQGNVNPDKAAATLWLLLPSPGLFPLPRTLPAAARCGAGPLRWSPWTAADPEPGRLRRSLGGQSQEADVSPGPCSSRAWSGAIGELFLVSAHSVSALGHGWPDFLISAMAVSLRGIHRAGKGHPG